MWDATPRAAAPPPGAHGSPSEPSRGNHRPATPHLHPTLRFDPQRPSAGFSSTLKGKTTTRQGLKFLHHVKVPAHWRGPYSLYRRKNLAEISYTRQAIVGLLCKKILQIVILLTKLAQMKDRPC